MAKKNISAAKAKKELAALKKRFRNAEKKAIKYVKNNPKKSALIAATVAAAIGAGLAVALRKKRKKR